MNNAVQQPGRGSSAAWGGGVDTDPTPLLPAFQPSWGQHHQRITLLQRLHRPLLKCSVCSMQVSTPLPRMPPSKLLTG